MYWNLFIQGIIAIGAMAVAIYAIKTYRINWEAQKANIAAASEPGSLIRPSPSEFVDGLQSDIKLRIHLINYGINPASNIEAVLYGYNNSDINGTNKNPEAYVTTNIFTVNPLPKNADLFLYVDLGPLNLVNYIGLRYKYIDDKFNKPYIRNLYWQIKDDKLVEPPEEDYKKLVVLLKDTDFYGRFE